MLNIKVLEKSFFRYYLNWRSTRESYSPPKTYLSWFWKDYCFYYNDKQIRYFVYTGKDLVITE
jgi:hypothetical protein